MNERFTVEEINLMCIFLTPPNGLDPDDTSGRVRLIAEITDAIEEFDTGDPQSNEELREIAANAVAKLKSMNDSEFSVPELLPEYSEYDETEV